MGTFDRILCPLDFSDNSVKAVQWVENFARKFGSDVTFLNVLEDYPSPLHSQNYEEMQASVLGKMHEFLLPLKIRYKKLLSTGEPCQKILAMADTISATCILLSTRGLKGHALLGSTTETVVRTASIPVITISPNCESPHNVISSRTLVPVSTLRRPPKGYAKARRVLKDLGKDFTLLHVVDYRDEMFGLNFQIQPFHVTEYEVTEKKQELRTLASIMFDGAKTDCAELILFGEAGEEIVKESSSGKYGSLLMMVKGKVPFSRFFNSTVYSVVRQASVPAITVKTNGSH